MGRGPRRAEGRHDLNLYVESSALAKLVIDEPEAKVLRARMKGAARLVSSEISEIEVVRAARRRRGARAAARAADVLEHIHLIELDAEIRRLASTLGPPTIRTLDAIHIATAISLAAPDLVFVGYDRRMQAAAADAGLEIQSPGV